MFKPLLLCLFLWSLFSTQAQAQSTLTPVSTAIHQIRYQTQQQHLSLLSSQPLQPDIHYISDSKPQKIVVDLPDTVFPNVHQEIIPTDSRIDRIRISQFENNPPKVRMVLDLRVPLDINIRSHRKGKHYETRIEPVFSSTARVQTPSVPRAPANNGGKLLAIEAKGQNIELKGSTALYPEIRRNKANPRQYTLTLYDFETQLKGMINDLKSPLLEYASVNNTSKGVEIQLQLSRNNIEIIPFSEGNRCVLQFLVKANDKDLSQLENLEIDELDRRTTRLKLYSSKPFDYQVYPLENPHRLVIDTMGTELENPALARALRSSQNIKGIRFIPTQSKENTDIRMVLDLHDQVKYEYTWRSNYLEILLQGPERAPIVTPSNRKAFIVIDAGHGGNDPGAIGPSKTQEKEVTLAVARYLERYLMNDQIQVAMTRSEDLEILLQPRVDVANLRNADLFISIHANSMPPGNTHVRGIETYYTTAHSKGLADTIHKYMIKELGAPDRRVRSRGLFVTRRSKMPSVLLEIGFLSSPSEEALLSNPAYQRKVAKAIRDGIQAYLSENPGIQNRY